MDYDYLNKPEYRNIPMWRIADNRNNLPFFIAKLNYGNASLHRHEFVQIVYISKGRLRHVLNKSVFDVHKGDIFVIPPYIPHRYIDAYGTPFEIIEFEFQPEFISEKFSAESKGSSFTDFAYLEPFLVVEKEMHPRLNLTGSIQIEVEQIFAEIIREYTLRKPDFELYIKALLLKLLVMVGREFRQNIEGSEDQKLYDLHKDALYAAIRYIHDHYSEDLSLDQVAKVAMVSSSYFRYLFKQMTSKTFVEYLNGIRIDHASEMLKKRPNERVIDICYRVGYHNVSHFDRTFRQATGLSPTDFRRIG